MGENAKPDLYCEGTLKNPCQDGTNTYRCLGEILKNDNSLVQNSKNLAVDIVYNIRCADGLSVGFI
jgi:hypothetical protein